MAKETSTDSSKAEAAAESAPPPATFGQRAAGRGNPTQENPTQENPTQEHPTQENPTQENPTQEHPTQEHPTQEHPTQEHPTQEHPTQENPTQEHPPQENPTQENPTQENPTQENPTQENPTQENPTQENPTQENSPQENPTQENPTQENPTQENPTQENPTQENSPQENPTQEHPTQENPTQEHPTQENSPQENPTQENPTQENPTQEHPTQEHPTQENSQESPAAAAVAEGAAPSSGPAPAPKKKPAAVELAVDAVIEARELRKTFNGLVSVEQVSFRVRRGEVLGFLGPNGAGKTTTMRMIAGFLQPTSGTAFVGGFNVRRNRSRVCRQLGYLAEGTPAYGDMNVRAYLDFIAEIHLLDAQTRKERKQAVIEALDLESVLGQRIHTLSKGFKRRVGLAQAIVHDPTALILDEPTDGLDPNQKQQVRRLIRQLSHDKGIVISTHILEEVSSVCSRVLILHQGRILIDETPEQMIARSPLHGALTALFSGPVPPGAVEACKRHEDIGDALVESFEGRDQLTVVPGRAKGALLPALQQIFASQGWEAQNIRPRTGQLDEVFRQLTTDAPAQ